MVSVDQVLGLAIVLFSLGLVGAVRRRHVVVVLFCLQLVTIASALALVGFNRMWAGRALAAGQVATLEGQAFAFLVLVVGVVQLLVGMGLALAVVRHRGSADIDESNLLGSSGAREARPPADAGSAESLHALAGSGIEDPPQLAGGGIDAPSQLAGGGSAAARLGSAGSGE
jgi:NADH-quinone oxidoreductase subunit K